MLDQINQFKVFVAVAETQGFAPAARKLAMSPPSVTRAIASLEKSLSVKLFKRTTRFVHLTEAGNRYLDDVKKILHDIHVANEAVQGINSTPQGNLSITAPVLFGQKFVLPTVLEYLKKYPDTQFSTVFLDRIVNLIEEGFDIGVRIGELPNSSMRAKKVGNVRISLIASPDYLKKHGIPQHYQELQQHQLIGIQVGSMPTDWKFIDNQRLISVAIQSRLTVTTNQAAIEAAKSGYGIARIISYQVADDVKNNQLKFILENYEQPPLPINIVHREDGFSSKKVRAFIDLLAKNLLSDSRIN